MFKHKAAYVAPGHWQVQLRAAGHTIGIIKLAGVWTLVHPRLSREESEYRSFAYARNNALAIARELDGVS